MSLRVYYDFIRIAYIGLGYPKIGFVKEVT